MTYDASTDIKKGVNGSLWIGILLIVLGIVAVAQPAVSTLFAETWFAWILISAGSAKLGYAFQTRNSGGFIWKLLLSILYIAIGLMLFISPLKGALTLTLLLGSFLLAEGVFNLILAFRLRPQQNWTWVLLHHYTAAGRNYLVPMALQCTLDHRDASWCQRSLHRHFTRDAVVKFAFCPESF